MRRDQDPDGWDWTAPQPTPAPEALPKPPPERSPYAPSLATKLGVLLLTIGLFGGSLVYLFRYQLGLSQGSYAFMSLQHGTTAPVTYQSCVPITYVVDDTQQVQGGDRLIEQAVAEISRLTGLQFVSLGTIAEPVEGSGVMVRIAWTDDRQVPQLVGDTVGIGGSSSIRLPSGRRYYDSGEISLDSPDLAMTLVERGPNAVRAVIMHELGHVVGLDHVRDRNELMNEKNLGKTEFGPGDLEGLELLGSGGCERAGEAQPAG